MDDIFRLTKAELFFDELIGSEMGKLLCPLHADHTANYQV